jgi:hypothetical protein
MHTLIDIATRVMLDLRGEQVKLEHILRRNEQYVLDIAFDMVDHVGQDLTLSTGWEDLPKGTWAR